MVRDRAELEASAGLRGDFDPVHIAEVVRRNGHNHFLGLRYIAHGADWMELALDPREELMAEVDKNVLASGPIIALMDVASSLSIWVRKGKFEPHATLDLRVDYLRPARAGHSIHGRGECYRITRNIAFVRGQAHDGDPADPLAHVAGTFMFTGKRP
ncbi:MAG: phenylacetic acid degradation-like protein [Sphingomonas bacterium]|nr:phenylacetic acid degradation-like protein [Sphingomonas bacterium]